jgi:benzoyl-CoA reductase/2-hydroxyglutaryl-CoA dehydratase subunit BcrC/BadD/HgdB
VARLHEGKFSEPLAAGPSPTVPLALVGGPVSTADWKLFDAVKSVGGRIVLNAAETGERSLCPAIGKPDDLFAGLADGYFDNITDVYQRPNGRLYSWLQPRLLSRGVRGIILWCFTGCDLWRAQMQSLREAYRLPVLLIEADEAAGVSPRDTNRLGAFVETLE